MKKMLGKKSTLISLIVTTIIMTVLLIYFCVRPVSLGYTYSGENISYHFNIIRYEKTTTIGSLETTINGYFFEKDGYLVTVLADNKEDFETQKEGILNNWGTVGKLYQSTKINAFRIQVGDETVATSCGAIVTVVIFAVIDLALITLTVFSILSQKQKKTSKKRRK